jgi:hypothetical protein
MIWLGCSPNSRMAFYHPVRFFVLPLRPNDAL